MAFALRSTAAATADMNITPLVDVMLVLLVIFMVATPVVSQQIPFELPQAGPVTPIDHERIHLRIDAAGAVSWDGRSIAPTQLAGLLQVEAGRSQQPVIEIEVAPDAPYARVTDLLASARNAGLEKIGFAAL